MRNPFTLSFGRVPGRFIDRLQQKEDILYSFCSDDPPSQIYTITGPRGSGKTVMLTSIASELVDTNKFIHVDLNPSRDILTSLAAKLYSQPGIGRHFMKAKVDFSAFGIGVSVADGEPVADIELMLEKMFDYFKEQGNRVLITIDEVVPSKEMRIFANAFQILLRQNAPIFLLITGLFENIHDLQNEKTLTFLYRAPKIHMEPLSATSIQREYARLFDISSMEAAKMATLTRGYPYAFQLLGYLRWEKKDAPLEEILDSYDQYLSEYVYEKMWSEFSENDKLVAKAIVSAKDDKVASIREEAGMNSSLFSSYRERLNRRGLINTQRYGHITFTLPRFEEFVTTMAMFEEL